MIEGTATILDDLSVLVTGSINPAEPDVGIFNEQPEVGTITLNGTPISDSMYERMTQEDHDACAEALVTAAIEHAADYGDYLYEQQKDRELMT